MKTLDKILNGLMRRYSKRVPEVNKVTNALIQQGIIKSQEDISNDHVAFRTMGVKQLGIQSFEKIFLHHGYVPKDEYFFESKRLNARWYAPPNPKYPRIFISELRVASLVDSITILFSAEIIAAFTFLVELAKFKRFVGINISLSDSIELSTFIL